MDGNDFILNAANLAGHEPHEEDFAQELAGAAPADDEAKPRRRRARLESSLPPWTEIVFQKRGHEEHRDKQSRKPPPQKKKQQKKQIPPHRAGPARTGCSATPGSKRLRETAGTRDRLIRLRVWRLWDRFAWQSSRVARRLVCCASAWARWCVARSRPTPSVQSCPVPPCPAQYQRQFSTDSGQVVCPEPSLRECAGCAPRGELAAARRFGHEPSGPRAALATSRLGRQAPRPRAALRPRAPRHGLGPRAALRLWGALSTSRFAATSHAPRGLATRRFAAMSQAPQGFEDGFGEGVAEVFEEGVGEVFEHAQVEKCTPWLRSSCSTTA